MAVIFATEIARNNRLLNFATTSRNIPSGNRRVSEKLEKSVSPSQPAPVDHRTSRSLLYLQRYRQSYLGKMHHKLYHGVQSQLISRNALANTGAC